MSFNEEEDVQQEMQPQEENNEVYANDFHEEPADEEHHVNEDQPAGEEQPFADDQPAGEEQPFADDQPAEEEQPLADDHIDDQEQPTGEEQIADQEQNLDPTADDQDVQNISAEEQQELVKPVSEAASEQEVEPHPVEQDAEHSAEEEQLPVEQEPAEHLSEQQVVDDQPEQENVVEPEQQAEQEDNFEQADMSGEEEQAEEIAQPQEEAVEPEAQPQEDVQEPFEEIEGGENVVEPDQVQDEVVELSGEDHDQAEVVDQVQEPTEVVVMEPEQLQDEVVELAEQDQTEVVEPEVQEAEEPEQDLVESAKDEDEAPPAPEEQPEADQEENPEEDEDDGASGAAGETESATQQKSQDDPRSSADLQEIMKEFANTAQQDMVQPILTSMHRQSTEVKYEFDTVGEEQAKTSYEKLESERFNALVEDNNIGGRTTQQQDADTNSLDTAQSYDVGHTDSLIDLMNKTNGMARDLSNDTCCFSMKQSAEYLENDCCIGFNIKSMDRVFSEDIDYNNMYNNVPVVSMKQKARRHFSVGQNSPAISITSSVTDYAELFPDKINCARMPECNSCEHNFTDDEMAAGWHMWSLDKEAEYSKEQARTSHDPIPPSASAVVDAHEATTTSRKITVEKPKGGAYNETDNETNYEPARKPSRRSTTRQSASRKSHTQELAPNKSITRESASRKSNNLTAERSAARESGTRRSVTRDSRLSATKEQDPKDSHRSSARNSLSRKSANKETADDKTIPNKSMRSTKTVDGTTIHTTEEGKVYAVVDGEKKFSTEEGKYATVNDKRLSIPEGSKIYRTKSGAEYCVVEGVKVVTPTDKDRESYAVVKGSKVPTTEEGTYQVVNDQKIYTTKDGATYTLNKDGKKVFAQDTASVEKKHSVGDNAEAKKSSKKDKKKGNCFFKNMQQQPCFNNPFFNPYMQFGMCNPWMNGEFVLEKCDDGQMVWLMKPNHEKKRMVYYYDTSCDEGKKEKKEKLPDISQGQNVVRKKRSSKKKMASLPQMNPYMAAQMGGYMNPYQNQMNPYMQYQQMMAQNNMLKAMKKQRSSSNKQ